MLTALARKELRETYWIAAVALALYLYMMAGLSRGPEPQEVWQVDRTFGTFAPVAFCLAVALGLRQTVGESARGTFPFLLNRPTSRRRLLGTKLAVGAGLYLATAAVPILLFGFWAATPGKHASPFEWSMMTPSWQWWLAITLVYLGAFLAGLRPGRWHGTRLLPLAGAITVFALIMALPRWWITGLPAVLLVGALLVATILYVAETRDYS